MSLKVYKKGDVIFKEGDKISAIYLVQSGGISLCLIKPKKNIDLFQLGSQSVIGEQALFGIPTYLTSAIATTETKILEIPLEVVRQNIESGIPMVKVIMKSMVDKIKSSYTEVKSQKLNSNESSPCPDDIVPHLFSSIYYTVLHKGEKNKDGYYWISWSMLKQYTQKVFGQSIKRVEQVGNILVKNNWASYEIGKNPEFPDGPDEVLSITFKDLGVLESFFEYYQYYFYKPGKADFLKCDEMSMNILEGFIKNSEGLEPDRFGLVSIPYQKFQDYLKDEFDINLNKDHFNRIEQRGILSKKKTRSDNSVELQFELKEFKSYFQAWKILKEIEKWNEKGFVDPNEKEVRMKKKGSDGGICPKCNSTIPENAKFCPECGHSLKANI